MNQTIKSTTVIAVNYKGKIAIGADGQATLGNVVAKNNVKKLRKLLGGKIIVGFAGSTADAFSLLDHLERKIEQYPTNIERSLIELAKEWRTDRYLRKLEAMMIVVNNKKIFIVSGSGDVLEPDNHIAAIGSGANYAQSSAMAYMQIFENKENETEQQKTQMAQEIVKNSLRIAGKLCIYTNNNITIETPL